MEAGWQIVIHRAFADVASRRSLWDHWAADNPFLHWDWLSTWWEVYGPSPRLGRHARLCLLEIRQGQQTLGFLPLYQFWHPLYGRTLSFLGSGEVCSDYLGLIAAPEDAQMVAQVAAWGLHALATGRPGPGQPSVTIFPPAPGRLHRLDLDGMAADAPWLQAFLKTLDAAGWASDCRGVASTWRIPLPETWEDYLAVVCPKKTRQRFRKLLRETLSDPRFAVHVAEGMSHWQSAWEILVRLHQARRSQLGDPGCFSSSEFTAFHHRVIARYLPTGRAALLWVSWEDRPIAAEYLLFAGQTVMAYQSGLDPLALKLSPGHLATLVTIQRAISMGCQWLDYLRGDESYKARLGAKAQLLVRLRAAPPRPLARLRFLLWKWGRRSRQFVSPNLAASNPNDVSPSSFSGEESAGS